MKSLHHLIFTLMMTVAFLPNAVSASDNAPTNHDASEISHNSEIEFFTWWDNNDTPPLGFMFINFALLCVLVYLIMSKPIGMRVRNRKINFEKAFDEANKQKSEAELALANAKAKSESLVLEMAKIRKEISESGKLESERIAKEAENRGKRIKIDTEALVAQELARMSENIRNEVVEKVLLSANSILMEKITTSDQDKMAREYLKSMTEDFSQSSQQ